MKRYLAACALALGLAFIPSKTYGEGVFREKNVPNALQEASDYVLFRAPLLGEEGPKIDLQERMAQERRSESRYEMLRTLSEAGYSYIGGLRDSFDETRPEFDARSQREGIHTYLMFNGNDGLSVEEAKIKFSYKF